MGGKVPFWGHKLRSYIHFSQKVELMIVQKYTAWGKVCNSGNCQIKMDGYVTDMMR